MCARRHRTSAPVRGKTRSREPHKVRSSYRYNRNLALPVSGGALFGIGAARLASLEPVLERLFRETGRQRYRAGIVARRTAEDLAPVRALEETVCETAPEQSNRSPDRSTR